jgi:hypothetical protein
MVVNRGTQSEAFLRKADAVSSFQNVILNGWNQHCSLPIKVAQDVEGRGTFALCCLLNKFVLSTFNKILESGNQTGKVLGVSQIIAFRKV